jgi:6-phosphogluconolactonase
MFIITELTGGLTVFVTLKGKLKKVDQTTILAKDFKGSFTGATYFSDGKFLYASNRGEAILFQF